MTEQFALEVEAEGRPRHVGPFDTREEAEEWAAKAVRNGSWNAYPLAIPAPDPDPVQVVVDAWLIEGPAPDLHKGARRHLVSTWPTLGHALDQLAESRA